MEQHDVKLKVHIEADGMEALDGRRATPDNGAAPGGGAAPRIPGADPNPTERPAPPRPPSPTDAPAATDGDSADADDASPADDGRGRRRGRRRGLAPSARIVGREVVHLVNSARSGSLADAVQELAVDAAATVPGGGAVLRGALLAERYGPAVAAAIDAATPEALRPATRAASAAAESAARRLAAGRAGLNAIGAAADATVDLAAQDMVFAGSVDAAWHAENARREYLMAAELEAMERNRRILGSEAAGAALGNVLGQALAGGLLGSVGR